MAKCVNPLLQKERERATFNPQELTHMLDGGEERTKRRREINGWVLSEPVMKNAYREKHTANESGLFENAFRQGLLLSDIVQTRGLNQDESDYVLESLMEQDVGFVMHYLMFIPAISGMGTKQQVEKWLGPAKRCEIIGTYAQTELGHGSSLKTTETIAEYDPENQQFILNTMTPTGMKWWPGGLGRIANHVVLMANLVTNGRNCGLQPFIVNIRSLENHALKPGCEAGSIGGKFSRVVLDNGYLILKDVRIPRENLLMRNSEVTPDGQFVKKGADKSQYGTMVRVRAMLIRWASMWTTRAVIIATRYACVRTQGELQPGGGPVQIIDYLTQQKKIFPFIAQAYAFKFAEWEIMKSFNVISQQMTNGDFSGLPVLHANSSGLKAFCTEATMEAIESCRRSLGGHGYSLNSGVVSLYTAALGAVTYEGEATLMYAQLAKYLLKELENAMKGKKLVGELKYLNVIPKGHIPVEEIASQNLANLIKAFDARSYNQLHSAVTDILNEIKSGIPYHEAWNNNSLNMIRATKAHLQRHIVYTFCDNVLGLSLSPESKRVLSDLCILYAVNIIVEDSGDFIVNKALTEEQVYFVMKYETTLLKKLRPEAVALVDAFDYPDEALFTSLGNYDGHVYDRLVGEARSHSDNQCGVHPAIKRFYLPRNTAAKL